MDIEFLSIVGTQIMGTLQPWLSFVGQYGPSSATLLYTPRTEDIAKRLRAYAEKHSLGEVTLVPTDYALAGRPESAAVLAKKFAEKAADEARRICFNLDGGMNYLICGCVLALEPYKPLFIQTSRWNCLQYDAQAKEFSTLKLPIPFSVEDILTLQQVPYSLVSKNPDVSNEFPLWKTCKDYKISLPANHLKDVEIDGHIFDLVWNPGNNRLCFLKDWRFYIPSEERKTRERDFAHWGTDRSRSGELYDKQVFVLVKNSMSQERLSNESGNQLTVSLVETGSEIKCVLEDRFRFRSKGGPVKKLSAPEPSSAGELQNNTLVVCMGRNMLPTLLAICTHKPKHLVLCYTKDDEVVSGYVRHMLALASELGISSVEPIPFEIDGKFPDQMLPPVPQDHDVEVNVNITSGSKGQGAMLACWAGNHGFTVWSLNNKQRCCEALYNPKNRQPIPYELCDPALYFRLCGLSLFDTSLSEQDIVPDMPLMDNLLEFMRKALAAGRDQDLSERPVKIENSELDIRRLKFKQNGKVYSLSDNGRWFEQLTAVALLRAGASHVRVNTAMRWTEETQNNIIKGKCLDKVPHRLELDVVGTFDGDLVLVSCKSYDKALHDSGKAIEELEALAAAEAKDTGASLGRFGLRILAHMHCSNAYMSHHGRVMVIGWRDLCRPEELKKRIDELRSRQRSTN